MMTNLGPELSVVIPAYNEERGIDLVLTDLRRTLETDGIRHEVIVVDDGSQDSTAQLASQHRGVVVLRHKINRGYGAALKTGIEHASCDAICIVDADASYPTESIPEMVSYLREGYDMVVGARTGDHVAIPPVRRLAKWSVGKIANIVAGESIPDINSGLRVFKKSVLLQFIKILPNGFSFTTTTTLAMETSGCRVRYVPINYGKRQGESKFRPIEDTATFLQIIFRTILYFNPLKIFLPVSGLFILAGAVLVLHRAFSGRGFTVTAIVLIVTGVQLFSLGAIADLIIRRSK